MKIWTVTDLMKTKFPSNRKVEIALKEYAATDLDAQPLYELDGEEAPARLSKPVYWQGRQWAVTAYGLECLTYNYFIEASRLWENEKNHGWVMQIAPKIWSDTCDFAEALRIARHVHRDRVRL